MASASASRRNPRPSRPLPQPANSAMAATSARRRSPRGPAAQTVLPDEIWENFLCFDTVADLVRAFASYSSFRRIVSERLFLRRFRSLHPPPVLGFIRYGFREFLPVAPPHRSTPEARALMQAADFTFSFLPDPHAWMILDARDGRVVLTGCVSMSSKIPLRDFLVCDPLHRRYVKIPRIPDELLAASTLGVRLVSPVLAPAAENDGEDSLRVIWTVQLRLQYKLMAFVFSSCNQTWRVIISTTGMTACVSNTSIGYTPSYAHDCFYWMVYRMGYSLMLDTSEMKFSIVDLPPHNFDSNSRRAIVEADEGKLRFLSIADGAVDIIARIGKAMMLAHKRGSMTN